MSDLASPILYVVLIGLFLLAYLRRHRKRARVALQTRTESIAAGLTEPASLHPVIDPAKCIGCLACADACPEMPAHTVIGIVHGKAALVSPTDCIGHGACQAACPVDAIVETRVFEYHMENRGENIMTKEKLLAVGDKHEASIAADRAAEARYR